VRHVSRGYLRMLLVDHMSSWGQGAESMSLHVKGECTSNLDEKAQCGQEEQRIVFKPKELYYNPAYVSRNGLVAKNWLFARSWTS
jgi:hypothetical protein